MRMRLPNACETRPFECTGLDYIGAFGWFSDGRLAEVFIGNSKAGSHSDSTAKDAAVVASIALQHGVPLDVIRKALMRDSHGRASSSLGVALDLIAEGRLP
jgi:hypothetical protein